MSHMSDAEDDFLIDIIILWNYEKPLNSSTVTYEAENICCKFNVELRGNLLDLLVCNYNNNLENFIWNFFKN